VIFAEPSIPNRVYSNQLFRVGADARKFLADLHDRLVQDPSVREIFIAPDLVEDAVTGKDLSRMIEKKLQEFHLAGGEGNGRIAAFQFKSLEVEYEIAGI
jgi:hypothetical protein